MQPKNWPKGFIYIPTAISTDIHEVLLDQILDTKNPEDKNKICPCIHEKRVHPDIKLRKITKNLKYKWGKIHPLTGQNQYGVFATKTIQPQTVLGEYAGEYLIKKTDDTDKNSKGQAGVYTWKLTINGCNIYLYSGKYANEISFVNDYRTLADQPNTYCSWSIHRGKYYLTYISSKKILKNEEVLVDYGRSWEKAFEEVFPNLKKNKTQN